MLLLGMGEGVEKKGLDTRMMGGRGDSLPIHELCSTTYSTTTSCSYSSHLPDLLLRACPDNCHLNTPPSPPHLPPIFRKRKGGFCPCLDFPPSWHWRKMRKSESETPSFPPFPSFTLGRFSVRREKVGDGAKRGDFRPPPLLPSSRILYRDRGRRKRRRN